MQAGPGGRGGNPKSGKDFKELERQLQESKVFGIHRGGARSAPPAHIHRRNEEATGGKRPPQSRKRPALLISRGAAARTSCSKAGNEPISSSSPLFCHPRGRGRSSGMAISLVTIQEDELSAIRDLIKTELIEYTVDDDLFLVILRWLSSIT